jgi:hypothetical protein
VSANESIGKPEQAPAAGQIVGWRMLGSVTVYMTRGRSGEMREFVALEDYQASAAQPLPPVMPPLPDWLLVLIGNYGAACGGRREVEALHHWQELIRGIKRYAAPQPAAAAPREPVEHDECPTCLNNKRYCKECESTGFVPAAPREPAPAVGGVQDVTDEMVSAYLKAQAHAVSEVDRKWAKPGERVASHLHPVRDACRAGLKAALHATPPAPHADAELVELLDSIADYRLSSSISNREKVARLDLAIAAIQNRADAKESQR